MGQKVHPIGFRLGITKDWLSKWYADKDYAKKLHEDLRIRSIIKKKFYHAGISKVIIERQGIKGMESDKVRVTIYTARPGLVIGRKGAEIEKLKGELSAFVSGQLVIDVKEVPIPELDAQLVAENIAMQIERRVSHRRAMKRAINAAFRYGAKGIRVECSGRLAGVDMARTEWYREGKLPLQTIRADIDYGFAEAITKYGVIGVKVWIFKGEVIEDKRKKTEEGSNVVA
ncbi:MAG: 30S ribosomal protein S3 [Thermosulfidibacteraceae bacterium]